MLLRVDRKLQATGDARHEKRRRCLRGTDEFDGGHAGPRAGQRVRTEAGDMQFATRYVMFGRYGIEDCQRESIVAGQDKKWLQELYIAGFDGFLNGFEAEGIVTLPDVAFIVGDLYHHDDFALASAFRQVDAVDADFSVAEQALVVGENRVRNICGPADAGLFRSGKPLVEG